MSEFVRDGEGERESRVFVHVAAAMRLTHARHLRQAESAARFVHARTDVISGNQFHKTGPTERSP